MEEFWGEEDIDPVTKALIDAAYGTDTVLGMRNACLLAIIYVSGGYIPVASALKLQMSDFRVEKFMFREGECSALRMQWTTRSKRRGLHIPLKNTAVGFILRWLKWLRENGFDGRLFAMSRQRAYQILRRCDPERAMRLRIRRLDVIYDV